MNFHTKFQYKAVAEGPSPSKETELELKIN